MEFDLPPDFAWYPPPYTRADEATRCLVVGGRLGVEVALVGPRVDGRTWLATVNRHLDWKHRGRGIHATRDEAMRMVSRWATAHAERLRAETEAKRKATGLA